MRFATIASLAAAASALSIPMPRDADSSRVPTSVFYFLVNKRDAGSIVAVDSRINSSNVVSTPTGGKGDSIRVIGRPDMDIGQDILQSAFSIIVDQNLLFAVSPGSDQLSMFNINPSDPLHPKLVGQPVSSNGDFPVSVAYSRSLNKACVLNAGAKNGVQCYNVDTRKGLTPDGALRALSQTNQTTPPADLTGASALSFNSDSSILFVSQKTSPIVIYPVQNGRIAQEGVASNVLPVAFAHKFVTKNTIFNADPTFGGSLLSIDKNFKVTEVKHTDEHSPVVVLSENCWATYVPRVNKVYTSAANSTHLGVYDATTGAFDKVAPFSDAVRGALDSLLDARDGRTIWFATPLNAIASYDAIADKPGDMILVDPAIAGARHYWQGLAQWTAAGRS